MRKPHLPTFRTPVQRHLSLSAHAFLSNYDSSRCFLPDSVARRGVIPEGDPAIFGVMNRYPIGSAVNVTCVFGPSKPPAELTWYINGDKNTVGLFSSNQDMVCITFQTVDIFDVTAHVVQQFDSFQDDIRLFIVEAVFDIEVCRTTDMFQQHVAWFDLTL
ncbi:ig-like domain-containing protein [Trichonephila clavipes]|nr:ig-like domain-containing protein [Trichonephila clavipes]